jgi:hypothetical protein
MRLSKINIKIFLAAHVDNLYIPITWIHENILKIHVQVYYEKAGKKNNILPYQNPKSLFDTTVSNNQKSLYGSMF